MNYLVVGAGNASRPVARLLNYLGHKVIITDLKEISEFKVTICPCKKSFLIITEGCIFILSARSLMVRDSGMVITLICSSTTVSTFFSGLINLPGLFFPFNAPSSSS
ncbi:MAG: hypothetical protein E7Z79_03340 [Methanobrevibacter thaueri]|uniref:Uncharacterized protein n=1 Tax=Methanobrevibacter thaueri TaxID=190975 RepID=A0A8T3VBY9_9EURY|nr:hypothetical protein [Methanobrevibacter thaueri]